MSWRLLTAYADYLYQMHCLLRAPVYHGKQIPHGNGEPVLLIPGFLTGDWSLALMAGWLKRIGYQPYCSGIDWNISCPEKTAALLRWRLDYIVKETHAPVSVVGHSLGGVLARFLGASNPHHVRQVISIGSPIDGSMRVHPLIPFTFKLLQRFQRVAGEPFPPCAKDVRCSCAFVQLVFASLPPEVKFTTIFSKRDELVDWRACVDLDKENYEVSGQHLGLVVNSAVYRILATTLANLSPLADGTLCDSPARRQRRPAAYETASI